MSCCGTASGSTITSCCCAAVRPLRRDLALDALLFLALGGQVDAVAVRIDADIGVQNVGVDLLAGGRSGVQRRCHVLRQLRIRVRLACDHRARRVGRGRRRLGPAGRGDHHLGGRARLALGHGNDGRLLENGAGAGGSK